MDPATSKGGGCQKGAKVREPLQELHMCMQDRGAKGGAKFSLGTPITDFGTPGTPLDPPMTGPWMAPFPGDSEGAGTLSASAVASPRIFDMGGGSDQGRRSHGAVEARAPATSDPRGHCPRNFTGKKDVFDRKK